MWTIKQRGNHYSRPRLPYGFFVYILGTATLLAQINEFPVASFGDRELLIPAPELRNSWAIGDLDADDDLDFIIRRQGAGYQVMLRSDDGTYSKLGSPFASQSTGPVQLGDVDGDGNLDAWIDHGSASQEPPLGNSLWLNDGKGSFVRKEQDLGKGTLHTHLLDIDHDNDLDALFLQIPQEFSMDVQVWHNDGNGAFQHDRTATFSDCSWAFGFGIGKLADFNGDGRTDWFRLCEAAGRVFLATESGRLSATGQRLITTSILTPFQGKNVAVGDVDNDQDIDVFVPNGNFSNTLWLNSGSGFFTAASVSLGSWSSWGTMGDIDGDGNIDIMVRDDSPKVTQIYWNDGDLRFREGPKFNDPEFAHPQLIDVDSDRDLDLIFVTSRGIEIRRTEISFVTPEISGEEANIPDPQLKRILRAALGLRPDFPIGKKDLLGITELDCSHSKWTPNVPIIEDLTGLELAVNLADLNLSGSSKPCFRINDLEKLSTLPNLKKLNISHNQQRRLEFAAGFDSIEELNVSDSLLRTLTLTHSYPNLRTLQCSWSQLTSLTLPTTLPRLETLWGHFNKLSNIQLPESAPKLRRLILSENRLGHLRLPSDALELEWLSAANNPLETIELPPETPALFWLDLNSCNRMANWSFLSSLQSLTHLEVSHANFNPSHLQQPLVNLKELLAGGSSGPRFELANGFKNLTELRLAGSNYGTIKLPDDLSKLEILDLTNSNLSGFEIPQGLSALEHLALASCSLRELSLPTDLTKLASIDLSRNQLRTLVIPEGVGSESSNHSLYLSENPLRSLKLPGGWKLPSQMTTALIPLKDVGFTTKGEFRLAAFGPFGKIDIQKSTNLIDWKTVATVDSFPTGRAIPYRDPNQQNEPHAFYRVRYRPR